MHVAHADEEASAQQEALGIVGVKPLLRRVLPNQCAGGLVGNRCSIISPQRRIEIDMLEFSGIEFRNVEQPPSVALKLVQLDEAGRPMFGPNRECCSLPTCCITSRPGRARQFSSVTYVTLDMLECALPSSKKTPQYGQARPLSHERPCAICWPAARR